MAKGQGGKSHQDRELAAEVRSLVLLEIKKVFEYEFGKKVGEVGKDVRMAEYKKQLILKMSTSILPRLNEVGGLGGGNLVVEISGESAKRYGITPDTEHSSS